MSSSESHRPIPIFTQTAFPEQPELDRWRQVTEEEARLAYAMTLRNELSKGEPRRYESLRGPGANGHSQNTRLPPVTGAPPCIVPILVSVWVLAMKSSAPPTPGFVRLRRLSFWGPARCLSRATLRRSKSTRRTSVRVCCNKSCHALDWIMMDRD